MKIFRYLAFPFAPIYFLVTWCRNIFYDFGIKKSKSYNFPVICVGNLSAGGTGKTPMIEYLIRLLKDDYKIASLSRGYKRQTKGFQLANHNASAESVGDEPFQFYNKFGNDILVAVDANRQNGISELQQLQHKPEIILLDDAYQHRKVKAGFNILLTTYANPYFTDYILPAGNLREPKKGASRANIIVVTKCPKSLTAKQKNKFIKQLKPKYDQHVFFSCIEYSENVISYNSEIELKVIPNFTLVTGIANSKPLVDFLNERNLKFEHLNFKDHHEFSQKDISQLEKRELILTTEKDFMRLKQYESLKDKLFYLPIKLVIDEACQFDDLVKCFLNK